MFFAKFSRLLTACFSLITVSACMTSPPEAFNYSEALTARANLALAYLAEDDFAKAKENIDRAMGYDPHHYLPHALLAYYYQQLDHIENAEQSYQQALALSDHQPDILNNYGTFLCKQHKFETAIAYFEQALATEQPYHHQIETLENMAICAKQAHLSQPFTQAITLLQQLSPERAGRIIDKK